MKKTKTKPTKPPILPAEDAANNALASAIEWAQEYGRMSEIAAKMSDLTGNVISRQMVGKWLAKDPTKRQQPGLGNGLMLLYTIEVMSGTESHWLRVLIRPTPAKKAKRP